MSAEASGKRKTGVRRGGRGPRSAVSRTSEIARNRERRSLRLRMLAFAILILLILLAATYQFWLRDSSLVSIRNLEVTGVNVKTEEGRQIDAAIRTAMGEMSTLNVNPAILDQELARYPRVAETTITTSFPDSATVKVRLRQDGSIAGEGADAMLVATDGTVLGPAGGQEESLPLISETRPATGSGVDTAAGQSAQKEGEVKGTPAAGEQLTGRDLAQALALGATPPEIRPFVTRSRYSPNGLEMLLDNGMILLFRDASHAEQKWRAAATLIASPEVESNSYVDLTVPRRPAVTTRGSAYTSTGEGVAETPEPAASG